MTTIAIGLDSADPFLFEEMLAAGALPNFRKVRERGAYGRLANFDIFTAELPWTTFATGVPPEETGYWTPLKYTRDYKVHTRAAYEYDEYPPFFALDRKRRVCCFDVPQVRLQKSLNGMQFNAWGAHSPQVPQLSNVPDVFRQLIAKYGEHPGLHDDYAVALDMDNTKKVYERLMTGIARRGKICVDLLRREPWDLFLTVFGEPHGGGHNLWQFEPGHPLCTESIPGRELLPQRPMWNIMQAIDTALGEILKVAPKDANIVLFSPHGMGPNTMDLPSLLFLPEFMYRWNFGRAALGQVDDLVDPFTEQEWGSWFRHVWNTNAQGDSLIRLARKHLPSRLYDRVAPHLEPALHCQPMNPVIAERRYPDLPAWQPALWYSNCWPQMKAFALMSFSEGYIRLNVRGREKEGIVEPADFQAVVNDICNELKLLKCARTGTPMVKKVLVTRQSATEVDKKLPDADIVISWQETFATDAVSHPEYGRIGPVPHFRAGSHRHTGFMLMAGQGTAQNAKIVNGHALDIAPTILAMMGGQAPAYMKGKPVKVMPISVGAPAL
ncbi:alkaline phosphatase family protein [Microbulbifer magnicolonia]|uniref:alkaline phosphatase family protein n=1 Tax=Microbulbifer magnicolonia TaxID=3109744 RepID=UPI002B418115|nr:alkaline phosphatase family protein [Microbulbifer sp. GG15]